VRADPEYGAIRAAAEGDDVDPVIGVQRWYASRRPGLARNCDTNLVGAGELPAPAATSVAASPRGEPARGAAGPAWRRRQREPERGAGGRDGRPIHQISGTIRHTRARRRADPGAERHRARGELERHGDEEAAGEERGRDRA
jgi:hypothetical protein